MVLAGLDVEVVAIGLLFALLIGVMLLRPLLVAALGQAPFIGGWLSSQVDNGLNAWLRAIAPLAGGALGAFAATVQGLQQTWGNLTTGAGQLGATVHAALWRVANLYVPHLIWLASQQLETLITAARAYAWQLYVDGSNYAAHLYHLALANAAALYNSALVASLQLFNRAEYDARLLAQGLQAQIAAVAQADRAFTVQQTRAAEARADQLFGQAEAIAAAADAALRGDLGREAAQLGRAIESGVSSLERQITADKLAAATGIAAGVAAVMVSVRAIENSRCMRACDQLGALGEGLQDLDLLGLIAFVAAAEQNPGELAKVWSETIQPAVAELGSFGRSMIGGK